MAPTEQNIEDAGAVHSQLKKRLSNGYYKSENSVPCFENNNTVLQNSVREKDNEAFDINKYEAMEFKAKFRWPDLTVQILLHLVSIYAVYLILSLQVKILTVLFGKQAFNYIFLSLFLDFWLYSSFLIYLRC